ncbi:hypothetical protein [uncultured Algibacter sp.]|uniref:hypothetical protein n=1 Tax=uncultured Algibacter sp. TaxID=298659 RepID=UPI00262E8370|nr:hypothetical protein [uncultured Algibacter sp.]
MKFFKLLFFILSITFATQIVAQTVYTTKTGEKYHKATCHYLKYSKKEYSLDKAKFLGFSPCSVCKPNANNTTATTSTNFLTERTITKTSTATQCTGKTKSGNRCKRKTKNANVRCYQH